jgi:hypothetical protein
MVRKGLTSQFASKFFKGIMIVAFNYLISLLKFFFIFINSDYDNKIKETISNYSVKSLESDNFTMGLTAEQDDCYNDLNKNRIFEEG